MDVLDDEWADGLVKHAAPRPPRGMPAPVAVEDDTDGCEGMAANIDALREEIRAKRGAVAPAAGVGAAREAKIAALREEIQVQREAADELGGGGATGRGHPSSSSRR